jgi:hypothetical protein
LLSQEIRLPDETIVTFRTKFPAAKVGRETEKNSGGRNPSSGAATEKKIQAVRRAPIKYRSSDTSLSDVIRAESENVELAFSHTHKSRVSAVTTRRHLAAGTGKFLKKCQN